MLLPRSKLLLADALRDLNGREIDVIIRPRRKQRTLRQNKLMHALFGMIGVTTGEAPGRVKDHCKRLWLTKHTSKLSRDEAAEFLEWLLAEAVELGVKLDPEIMDFEEDEVEAAK